MCRMVGWVSSVPCTLREALGDGGIDRLRALSTVHAHGWGAAWHDDSALMTTRSTEAAFADDAFGEFVDKVETTAGIFHLRLGTPGYARGTADTHPFAAGDRALIHNGAVGPVDQVDKLLATSSTQRPTGTTDSERWFLALVDELESGATVPAAVDTVIDRATTSGLHSTSWNSMLLEPGALHVIAHNDVSLLPTDIQLWPDELPPALACWPPYLDLRWRQRDGCTVVASSGVVDDLAGWTLLPNHTVLRLPADTSDEPELSTLG